MNKKIPLTLSYLEKIFDPSIVYSDGSLYQEMHEQNKGVILGRYDKIVNAAARRGVEAKKRVEGDRIEINLVGTLEDLETVWAAVLDPTVMQPGTMIIPYWKERGDWGSSEEGYRMAKKFVTGEGHKIRRNGEIWRRGFELPTPA